MATISGVNISLITSIGGVDITSISNIAGISTSNIPGWPTGASCTTVYYGYSDGGRNPPEDACVLEQFPYEWDIATGILYTEGSCGVELARPGYYSDGTTIYEWDGNRLSEYGSCGPAVGPVNTVLPSIPAINTGVSQITADRGTWTVAGTGSWVYNWYSNSTLIATKQSPVYDPKTNTWNDVQPVLNINYNWLFTNIHLEVIGSDDTGTAPTVSSNYEYYEDLNLDTFLANSGIQDTTTINALQYLQKELRVSQLYDYALIDYYPMVGTTADQMKWSLKNPNNYFVFNGGWTFSSNGAQADSSYNSGGGSYADSTYQFYLSENIDFAIYNGANVIENSIDINTITYNTDTSNYQNLLQMKIDTPSNIAVLTGYQSLTATNSISPTGLIGAVSSIPDTYALNYQMFVNNTLIGSPGTAASYTGYPQFVRIGAGMQSFIVTNTPTPYLPGNKLYQFVLLGKALGSGGRYSALNTIISTFQSMLGR